MRRALLALALLTALAVPLGAQPRDAAQVLEDAAVLHAAHWGLQVVDLADGRVLYERDAQRRFVPASVQKLYTAAAALLTLGPAHRWATRVLAGGGLRAGTLEGALVLQGSGDPSLTEADLDRLAAEVASVGIHAVRGPLVLDDTAMPAVRLGAGWAWDDESDGYSAQLGALSVNENVARVRVAPALMEGMPARVATWPAGVLRLHAHAITGPADAEDTLRLQRRRARNDVDLDGTIPAGATVEEDVTVEDPTAYTGLLFARALHAHGIVCHGVARRAGAGLPVASHLSPPLRDLLQHMLKASDNFYAEQVGRSIAPQAGIPSIPAALRRLGLDPSAYRMADASGLSRYNLLRPVDTVRLLRAMASVDTFRDALPVSGRDGTLRRRMRGVEGRVIAKTGTLSGVSGLAGYVLDLTGRPRWAFAFAANGHLGSVKAVEDDLAGALVWALDAATR